MTKGNLFNNLPLAGLSEQVDPLLDAPGLKLERIVSHGHATPPGEWYDQDFPEWVLLLRGSAGLSIEGEKEIRILKPGDHILLPAHVKHRVEWTGPEEDTVWLALHYGW